MRLEYEKQGNEVMQLLGIMFMNSLFWEQVRRDIEEKYACILECWMLSEYDERVREYRRLPMRNYIVKLLEDEVVEDSVKIVNTLPLHSGALVSLKTRRFMKNYIRVINGFGTKDWYYEDTDSSYFEDKDWDELNKAEFFGKYSLKYKICYGDGGIFYGLMLALKMSYCLTSDKNVKIVEHKAFRGCTNISEKLNRRDDEVIAEMPLS